MKCFSVLSTFTKIKNHLNYFSNLFVFLNTLHLFPQIYSNLPFYKQK